MGRASTAKLVVLPLATLASLLSIWLVIRQYGDANFAVFALVAGTIALIPFADLGVGAAVTDAVARRGTLLPSSLAAILASSLRALFVSAGVLMLVAWLGAAMSAWSLLLGIRDVPGADLSVALTLSVFAIGLPITVGSRILTGGGQNHVVVLLQGSSPILALGNLGLMLLVGVPLWAIPTAPALGLLQASLLGVVLSRGLWPEPFRRVVLKAVGRDRVLPSIRHLAAPMLIVQVSWPIALQTHRMMLSWVSNPTQLVNYSLVAPLSYALVSVAAATSGSLWAYFAGLKSVRKVEPTEVTRLVLVFGSGGVALGAALVLAGPFVTGFLAPNSDPVPTSLFLAFSALVVSQVTWIPLSMALMDPAGLRFQAVWTIAFATLSVTLGVVMAHDLAAAGPPLASSIALVVCLIIPALLRLWKRDH